MSEEENLIASQLESGNLIFEKIEDSGSDEVNFCLFQIFVQNSYNYGTIYVEGT